MMFLFILPLIYVCGKKSEEEVEILGEEYKNYK